MLAEIRVKGRQVFRVIEEKCWQKFELQGILSYRGEMLVRIRVTEENLSYRGEILAEIRVTGYFELWRRNVG